MVSTTLDMPFDMPSEKNAITKCPDRLKQNSLDKIPYVILSGCIAWDDQVDSYDVTKGTDVYTIATFIQNGGNLSFNTNGTAACGGGVVCISSSLQLRNALKCKATQAILLGKSITNPLIGNLVQPSC